MPKLIINDSHCPKGVRGTMVCAVSNHYKKPYFFDMNGCMKSTDDPVH